MDPWPNLCEIGAEWHAIAIAALFILATERTVAEGEACHISIGNTCTHAQRRARVNLLGGVDAETLLEIEGLAIHEKTLGLACE